MRMFLMAGAAALTVATVPMLASAEPVDSVVETTSPAGHVVYHMTPDQQATYETWTVERRADYDAWPSAYQTYYWSLQPTYQTGYWSMTPEQRANIMAMNDAARQQAWDAWAAANPPAMAANTSDMPPATVYSNSPTVQGNMTPVAKAEYPICHGAVQDSCVNAWEAGKRGPGVRKPLNYWPGEPASQLGG